VVEWLGWRANMEKVYQDSHIVTLPTTYGEGVPTVLLEAAACGRPLVASDTPGCRQVVQDGVNGFLVPPNDPQALAAALERLVCDPDLRGRMGAAGRELVLQKFTHAQINAATLDVYARLLRSEI
jgi:glycosyltransferase involved in cell wall biosynthesis